MNPEVQASLERLLGMEKRPLPEYRDAITDELCYVTNSEISYLAAINLTEDTLTMIGWSRSAMQYCATTSKPLVYALEETGLWGDAVRERGPVITNNYPKLVKPTKKGYPQGHVSVQRHMNLPIFEEDRVVLVVGMGNKPTDYTMEDVEIVEELMYEVWKYFKPALWQATW